MSAYDWLRPLLFALEPEQAHAASIRAMQALGALPPLRALVYRACGAPEARPVALFGLRFPNAVGLAAGYDKDGLAWRGLAALGFGHVEVGTITPRPQPGNPQPRVFRLPEDQSLINRMGFPGEGAAAVAARLTPERPHGVILGANLGKNKDTPLADAAEDYAALIHAFAPLADYLAVNISSPNTPDLRRLQERDALEALLGRLDQERAAASAALGRPVPLLVKLAPDLSDAQRQDAAAAILAHRVDGVIATNTTTARDGLQSPRAGEAGGLSGAALRERSRDLLRALLRDLRGQLPVISVGGIMTPEEAHARLSMGASLVQLYTGLIYQGPALPRRILRGACAR